MVQFFQLGPKRRGVLNEALGESLGKGLANFTNEYYANKALQGVLQDKSLENAPYSEKIQRLHTALGMHGEAGQRQLTGALQAAQVRQGEQMFKKAKEVASKPNATPSEILFALMEAGQGIPGAERYIAPAFETLTKQIQAKAGQAIAPAGYGSAPMTTQQFSQQAPQFGQQPGTAPMPVTAQQGGPQAPAINPQQQALKPSPIPASTEAPRPRRTTFIQAQPLMTPEQMAQERYRIAQERTAQGLPVTPEEVDAEVQAEQNRRLQYANQVQAENESIRNYRDNLSRSMRESFISQYPNEVKKDAEGNPVSINEADFQKFLKYGLDAEDMTEPERFDYARKKYDQLRAARSAMETYPDRPNWLKDIVRKLEGSDRTVEQTINQLQSIVKPMVELGEYQEARDWLTDHIGLGLDETQRVLRPLQENVMKSLEAVPYSKSAHGAFREAEKKLGAKPVAKGVMQPLARQNLDDKGFLKNYIVETMRQNQTAKPDLIQIRNYLEKNKGYNWRDFADAVTELDNEGKLDLDADARNNIFYLYNPPIKGMLNIFKNIIFGKE